MGKFITWQKVNKYSVGKEIILFGAGNIAHKTLRKLDKRPVCIVDNNPNLWGTSQVGLDVKSTEEIKEVQTDKIFIIICTTSFDDVSFQLKKMGFTSGEDFAVSPVLSDLRIISELENMKAKLIFTSGAPAEEAAEYGGGVYELVVDEKMASS